MAVVAWEVFFVGGKGVVCMLMYTLYNLQKTDCFDVWSLYVNTKARTKREMYQW